MSNNLKVSSYKSKYKLENTWLIFHPFKSNENSNFNKLAQYANWSTFAFSNNIVFNFRDLHLALIEFYFGAIESAIKFKTLSTVTEDYYKSTILPLYSKIKMLDKRILPLGEQLEFGIFKEIIIKFNYGIFNVDSMYGPWLADQMSLEGLLNEYDKYKCWEIESLDKEFYFKTFEDDVVTIVSYNDNLNLTIFLEKASKSIDIFRI